MSVRSIALIDVDTELNEQLASELARHGLSVESFTDSTDILARKDNLPDLVVLCIDPRRKGWAVCDRLRKSTTLKSVPLIITSAEATEKDFDGHKKLKRRADEYLHKPFGVDVLVEKIGALIGLPQGGESGDVEILDSSEIAIEDSAMIEEEQEVAPSHGFDSPPTNSESGFGMEGDDEHTRVAGMSIDGGVDLETDSAFDSIGVSSSGSEVSDEEVPFAPPIDSESMPVVMEDEQPPKAASEEIDLGLDDVAMQATAQPALRERARRQSSPVISSAPPIHDTGVHDTGGEMVTELRRDRDRFAREVEELRSRLAAKPEAAPAPTGFSREKEFLNLREIINKKEKEVLDLRDALDGKERLILDGKDKLRELEHRCRDLDDNALAAERDLVAAREKIQALSQDKEKVLEREKQVKARLEDAQQTIARYEEEQETWKAKQTAHEQALHDMRAEHRVKLEDAANEHAAQLREMVNQHEQHKAALVDSAAADRELAVAELTHRHSEEAAAAEARRTQELEAADARRKQEVDAADARRVGELQAKAEEHRAEIEQLLADHTAEKQRFEHDHELAVQALDERRQQELRELAERLNAELAEKHVGEMKELADGHRRTIKELEETHADIKAGMQQRHNTQTDELKAQHAATIAEFETALKERDAIITDDNARITELSETLNQERVQAHEQAELLADTQAKLQAAIADIGERDKRIGEQEQRIAEIEQESAGYQDQILKAYQRIKSDESIVSRAKKALAIALTLLEESAPDGGDEAAS